jgi:PPP family 3-phenylpropionic acid transporter
MKASTAESLYSLISSARFNVCVIYFFAYASWAAWWPLFTIYLQNAGLSGVQTGLVSSIAPVMMFIVQPVWGVIADRYGRKRLLVLALILSALSLVAYLWITGFWPILILTVIFSLFLNPVYPVVDTLALDSLGKDKEFGFGYLRMWGAVGWLTGAFLAGQITGEQDVVTVFPLSAVLLGLACLFAFRVRTVKEVKGTLDMSWQNLSQVLRDPRLLIFLAFILLVFIGLNGILTFYGVYMLEIGATRKLIGWAISLQGFSELPFYLISAAILQRFGFLKTIIFTFFVGTLRAFLYAGISSPTYVILVELTHGISLALLIVAGVEYINRLVPSQWRATGQSLFWAAIFGAGSLLGNVGVGVLYDYMKMQKVFLVFGFLLLIASVLAVFLLKEKGTSQVGEEAATSEA